jgi:AraC-like DNA-binding protein
MFAHMPIIRDILLGAEKYGASLDEMCLTLNLEPAHLHNSEIVVPFETAYKTWEVALQKTDNPFLGLHLGEQTNPSIMGLVGHLMQSCRTLNDAFQSVCDNNPLVTDMFIYSMKSHGATTTLYYEPHPTWIRTSPLGAQQAVEQAMAGTLHVFLLLSGKKISPVQATLTYNKLGNFLEYQRVFQSPIKFKSEANALVFSTNLLQTPVLSYDESLIRLFNNLLQEKSSELKNKDLITHQIKNEILNHFKGQVPTLEMMASKLNMTARSLQRRLEDQQVTYRQITMEVGQELSSTLLKNKAVKIVEVARTLGYSDSRSFQRAFKTWTGLSPGEFRKTLN